MTEIGFSAEQYIEEQSKYILQRINCGNSERLYLEFGGKLVQDKHAMRVLPGFDENAKIKLLQKMKDKAEIIICIYSGDIMTNKTRQDFGITYDLEVLRLIRADEDLKRLPVVILSSSREESDLARSWDLGVNAYVVKPVDIDQFFQAVRTIGTFWALINQAPEHE